MFLKLKNNWLSCWNCYFLTGSPTIIPQPPISDDLYKDSVNHRQNSAGNSELRHRASLHADMDPTGAYGADDMAKGRPLSRLASRPGSSFHRSHMDTALEYELDKLKHDESDRADENRSELIRSMATTLNRKREIRWEKVWSKGKWLYPFALMPADNSVQRARPLSLKCSKGSQMNDLLSYCKG